MPASAKPALWIIAGPNGVGKTTYAYRHMRQVSGSVHFVNLDEIARGLSPFDPEVARESAARIALQRIRNFVEGQQSFSLETTLAGRTHLRTLSDATAAGFEIRLLYFVVPEVELCLARVARRVVEGGHNVPEADVRRRYVRSIANFTDYVTSVDRWTVLENSKSNPVTAAEGRRGCLALDRDVALLPGSLQDAIRALPPCIEA
jgi:predicted ABC-type ATPase